MISSPSSKRTRVFNNGFDDADHNYIIREGEVWDTRYRVHKMLGKGSFGQVVEAYDSITKESVAIKVIKNKKAFHQQAQIEISILQHLNDNDPHDLYNVVRLKRYFENRGHLCLVYELLSHNLYELLRNEKFIGLSLSLVRKFATQILTTLAFLSSPQTKIIHCDLKPENVLLRNSKSDKLKVVDFGSSCYSHQRTYTYIQSRFYRSPEVIMGHEYSVAIDMWSLGCMLVELHTGQPLFNGMNEHDQICKIHELLGVPPHELFAGASDEKIKRFFVVNSISSLAHNNITSHLDLSDDDDEDLDQECFQTYSLIPAKHFKSRARYQTLSDVIMKIAQPREREQILSTMTPETAHDYRQFIDLICQMLEYDPSKRITPMQALHHTFLNKTQATNTPTLFLRRSKRLQDINTVDLSTSLTRNNAQDDEEMQHAQNVNMDIDKQDQKSVSALMSFDKLRLENHL